jgi:hypothetical protein
MCCVGGHTPECHLLGPNQSEKAIGISLCLSLLNPRRTAETQAQRFLEFFSLSQSILNWGTGPTSARNYGKKRAKPRPPYANVSLRAGPENLVLGLNFTAWKFNRILVTNFYIHS